MKKIKKKIKISNLEKLSSSLMDIQNEYKSLIIQMNWKQENNQEIQNIKTQAAILRRKILFLNQQYIDTICKKYKIESCIITDLLKEGNKHNNAEI